MEHLPGSAGKRYSDFNNKLSPHVTNRGNVRCLVQQLRSIASLVYRLSRIVVRSVTHEKDIK